MLETFLRFWSIVSDMIALQSCNFSSAAYPRCELYQEYLQQVYLIKWPVSECHMCSGESMP